MADPRYDEERPTPPEHGFPEQQPVDLRGCTGAFARYRLEEVMSSAHGANLTALRDFGIHERELVRHRGALQQALRAAIAEGRGLEADVNRDVAIAYVRAWASMRRPRCCVASPATRWKTRTRAPAPSMRWGVWAARRL
jgi:hypothetical protein